MTITRKGTELLVETKKVQPYRKSTLVKCSLRWQSSAPTCPSQRKWMILQNNYNNIFCLTEKVQLYRICVEIIIQGSFPKNAAKQSVQRSMNMVWHHSSKSHNLSPPTPLWSYLPKNIVFSSYMSMRNAYWAILRGDMEIQILCIWFKWMNKFS